MPFPKISMSQISDKEVVVAVAEDPKLDHFKQHLDASGFRSSIESVQFGISFRNDFYDAPRILLVQGDIHDVSEIIRECWP